MGKIDMPKVLNKHRDKINKDDVYIGRGSKFGNPFVVGKDGSREEVIWMYKMKLQENAELLAAVKTELKGKNLVCFCAPRMCHGDVLLKIANEE